MALKTDNPTVIKKTLLSVST